MSNYMFNGKDIKTRLIAGLIKKRIFSKNRIFRSKWKS